MNDRDEQPLLRRQYGNGHDDAHPGQLLHQAHVALASGPLFAAPPLGHRRRHAPLGRTHASQVYDRFLEVLTKALDVSVGDEAGGEAEEGFVDVIPSFPSDA
ncbi:hypothetical protein [Streptomyces sp. NPDC058701]|uniref:hypothetical protein n=1 Tax=Streptomyces sp. NPDC058701 TaxID=3346608 RepID=UPI00365C653F